MAESLLIQRRFLAFVSLFIVFFVGVGLKDVQASHALGAEITYECNGPNSYIVTLKFYRDCNGIGPGSSHTVTYSSATCGVTSSITVSQVGTAVDITPICPSQSTACGGGGSFGIEEIEYQGTLNLPPGCGADWVLGWSICCRNYGVTTLNSSGNQSMYVSSLLDNTLTPCNNSPEFNNPPLGTFCNNQPAFYNPGATDSDGDSLVFSLTNCQQSASTNVNYGGGFNGTTPLATSSGVTINPTTGALSFTPNALQVGVLCVLVEEYRNGVKVGEIVRDIQFNVIACSNTPPVASGINGTAVFDTVLCVGASICFNVNANDPNSGDNIVMSWNNGIAGGSFTVANNGGTSPVGTFCWTPTAADAGTNFFTVTVEDDACPVVGQNTLTFQVDVFVSAAGVNAGPDGSYCAGGTANLAASAPGSTSIVWTPAAGLTNPNIPNPVASPTSTTTYTATATFPDGCVLQDNATVTVNPDPIVSLSPQVAYGCPGGTFQLTAQSPTAVSYTWSVPGNTQSINVSPGTSTQYWVEVTDANGCTARDTAQVNVNVPQNTSCNVVYASPTGNGSGTQASPANLNDAINLGACNNTVVKLAVGTYTIDTAIINITSNITLEGGFDPGLGWEKTSAPGATTIFRSTANPEGGPLSPRLVAIYMNSAQNFRFQDITIQTASANLDQQSVYGVHLTNCSNYNFTRTQFLSGNGGAGADGVDGANGVGGLGGGNGANGDNDSQSNSGPGGTGGGGAGAGSGGGGAGAPNPGGCCSTGISGSNGNGAGNARAGGGGGGGASGGEEDRDGGIGGSGGLGGAGSIPGVGGTRGDSDGCDGGDCGGPGAAGQNGANGSVGTPGGAGSHVGGFWVPGGAGTAGTDGTGGAGGGGGGGGGGQGGTFCTDGAGAGGGGGGGGGQGGERGTGGTGGGSSFPIYLFNNGGNGVFDDCATTAGAAGPGGAAGQGGAGGAGGNGGNGGNGDGEVGCGGNGGRGGDGGSGGDGGFGQPGQAVALHQQGGVAPTSQDITFNLSGQPVISMQNISCTSTNINFGAGSSSTWDLGPGSSPQNPVGSGVTTQYSTTGRKDILFGADQYTGFANIVQANNLAPQIGTSAPQIAGVYRVCEGTPVNFYALNGGINYVYAWNMGGSSAPNTYNGTQFDTLNNVVMNTVGTFNITLSFSTDCCGQSPLATLTIVVDPQPNLSVVGPTALCVGDTGSLALVASGADLYTWNPAAGLNTTTGSNVFAKPTTTTTYNITGSNTQGTCFDYATHTVTVNGLNLAMSSVAAACGPNGSASVNVTGGSGNYTIAWDNGASTATNINLQVGTYTVVVTDNITGCIDSNFVAVSPGPNTPVAFFSNITGVSCNGLADGSVTVTTIGGTPGYTYVWNDIGSAGATRTNLSPGTYTVTSTDALGCTYQVSAVVPEPAPLQLAVLSFDTATCPYTTDGGVTVNAGGGTGPFTYGWIPTTLGTSNQLTNVAPGPYTATVVDQNGCTDTLNLVIPSNPAPTVNLGPDTTICFGNSVTLDATQPGVTYTWSTTASTPTITTSTAGLYWVEVDNGSCVARDSIVVTTNNPPTVFLGNDTTLCQGETLILDATLGGSATYLWQDNSTNPTFNVTVAGQYHVTVDSGVCSTSDTINVSFDPPPVVNLGNDTTLCLGEPLTLDATVPGATYLWQNGTTTTATFNPVTSGTYWVDVTLGACTTRDSIDVTFDAPPTVFLGNDTTLCQGENLLLDATTGGTATYTWQDASTNPTFNVSVAGQYHVTVDSGVCSASDTINVSYDIPPVVNLGNDTTICSNATLVLDATTPGASYLWQDNSTNPTFTVGGSGQYHVTVSLGACDVSDTINVSVDQLPNVFLGNDTTLCQGSSLLLNANIGGTATYTWQDNSTNPTFNVTTAGQYHVTVDSGACLVSDTINVSYDVPPVVNLGNDTTICSNSSLLLDATTAGATYLWQDNSTNPTFTVTATGNYSVAVTLGACTVSDNINVTVDPLPVVDLGGDTTLCQGETLLLDASTPGGSYLWQDNSTNATFLVSTAGTYSVTVTAGACTVTDQITVSYDAPPVVDLGADTTLCEGESLTLDASTTGGSYLWSDNSSGATLIVTVNGNYSVDVSVGACTVTDDINVTFQPLPNLDLGQDTAFCNGLSWTLDATVPNGSYLWNDGSLTPTITTTSPGTFSVQVDDGICQVSDDITLTLKFSPADFSLGPDTVLCNDDELLLDGTRPDADSYLWSTGFIQPTQEVTDEGIYWVEVSNECGSARDSIDIERENCGCEVYFPNAFTPNADGLNDDFGPSWSCALDNYTLNVFDRWGKLIFQSNNPTTRWDGKFNGIEVAEGVYVYTINFTYSRGEKAGVPAGRSGSVTVIR